MPGAGWKRKGQMYRANMDQMSALPHQFVKDQMVRTSDIATGSGRFLTHPRYLAGRRNGDSELYVGKPRYEPLP